MLQISLLGHLRVLHDGTSLRLSARPKVAPLWAYLLLHRHAPMARETLAFTLWPDTSEAEARANLRRHLHELRQVLPATPPTHPWVLSDAENVHWNPAADAWLDVADFERWSQDEVRLADAVAIYTGDLLENLYEDWVLHERERLRQLYSSDLTRLIAQHELKREYRQAIAYGQRFLRHEPVLEEPYRHLMRLHALSGDRAGLVRYYNTCVTVLKRELEVEPSLETRELYEYWVRHDVASVAPLVEAPSLRARTNNLPIQLTSFIGREREIEQVKELLANTRLLTLTGAGGSGKTRLALAVAAEMLDAYADGVWLADLAPLADLMLVPQTVATALGVRGQPGRSIVDTLTDYLRAKRLLLLLDNCEHLIDACARLAKTLLQAALDLRILATSREALNILGERIWQVPPLSVPTISDLSLTTGESHSALSHSESVQLFIERAVTALPTFRVTAENMSAVGQICRALDGLPLAIELAAVRLKVLTVEQIAARLDDRFHLLTGGSRTALPRHQTLRATLDWSYDLLLQPERAALRQLSAFAGGWTFEAAEAVIGPEALDLLSHLVDKSLVGTEEHAPAEETRYHLLETIRQYAREKSVAAGEGALVRARHLNACLQFAEAVTPKLHGPEQVLWLQRVESDHDNLRAALDWAIAQGESAAALRLSGALGWFWFVHGHLNEGRQWLQQALALSRRATHMAGMAADYRGWYANALQAAGRLAEAQGDYATTQALNEESLALYRELGDRPGMALSFHWLGIVAVCRGDHAAARVLHEESLALYRELGDKGGISVSLQWLGVVASNQGDYTAARALQEESLALSRELGDKRNIAISLDLLGVMASNQGDYTAARALYQESLELYRELGDRKGIAECLPGLAAVAQADRQPQRATKLLGAVEALLERISAHLDPTERTDLDRTLAAARAQLDDATFNAAWAAGRALTLERAIEDALGESGETG